MNSYNFNISLSILNHLGRNLYRNFITVIGEAISNSWDADANNVWINIDKENKTMTILDDGEGMDENGFQNQFLKIGYSKRKNNISRSKKGRPFIGRKGIGKLALLSCAKQVCIATKTASANVIGGLIDNAELDQAITDDLNSQDYVLQPLSDSFVNKLSNVQHGTFISFININDEIINTIEYIRKAIALYFKFSLVDKDFSIYINGDLITSNELSDFALKTEFLWIINDSVDPFLNIETSIKNVKEIKIIKSDLPIKGFIATTQKPVDLKIRGTQEKITLDLFVNGRAREKDILKHIPTARVVENYTYGQIHCDSLDDGKGNDVFTSSREGIISNNQDFIAILKEVDRIFRGTIMNEWDELRRKYNAEGDPDNTSITKKERRAQELYVQTIKDMQKEESICKKGGTVEKWVSDLAVEAQFNIPSYTECFISENLLRAYAIYTKEPLSKEAKQEAENRKDSEKLSKAAANISYDVRQSGDDLYYLDMRYLSNFIDKAQDKNPGLSRSAIVYKPMRDAIGHTSLLTPIAKQQLTIEYNNIQARLVNLLKDFEAGKNKNNK